MLLQLRMEIIYYYKYKLDSIERNYHLPHRILHGSNIELETILYVFIKLQRFGKSFFCLIPSLSLFKSKLKKRNFKNFLFKTSKAHADVVVYL